MFQAERTKALGRNELGVFKKEKGNQFFWNTGRSILGEDRAHIRLKKKSFSFTETYKVYFNKLA